MYIKVGGTGQPEITLEDPADFRQLYVMMGEASDLAAVARALVLNGAGTMSDDGEYVWISIDWLRRHGSADQPATWAPEFEAMLVYAASRGWIDDQEQAVRGHVSTPSAT